MKQHSTQALPDRLKVLTLGEIVIFPMLAVTITARNRNDIELLLECEKNNELVAIANPQANYSFPLTCENIFPIGTACRISRVKMNRESQLEVVLEGICRISFLRMLKVGSRPLALIAGYPENLSHASDSTTQMLMESSLSLLRACCAAGQPLPESATVILDKIDHPGHLADLIIIYLQPDFATQSRALSLITAKNRLKMVHQLLYERQRKLNLGTQSDSPDPARWPQSGGMSPHSDAGDDELTELKKNIDALELNEATRKTIDKEFSRLKRMNPASPDYHNTLHYVEYISELPWQNEDKENIDIGKAEKILDEDHFGLEKVKERILEHLAVRQLNPNMKGPIICLVGAPGVGKTSLGKSIAKAMGRKFIRLSLGGVHDEAEIRGHRRTYLGAMPGKIVQELKRAGSRNPVFMLDEIDKLGRDFRGDPASALLEVMDPEQNNSFTDHYLNLPFDLSRVLFIATANQSDPIPAPLLDRMEIITLPGYSEEEKRSIACRYLIDRQRENHGLKNEKLVFTEEALDSIIDNYTRESGVRNLEKMIGKVMRKYARSKVAGETLPNAVTHRALAELLGPTLHRKELSAHSSQVGIVTGLAWTPTGGDILFIEAALTTSQKGDNLILTGSLGDVMKESAQIALSFLKTLTCRYDIDENLFEKHQIHIHIPSGAIPKDGPSAGLALFLTLLSLACNRDANHKIAVTGEISLSGRVLPVGGVKEKVLAARRAGIKRIILPEENLKNLKDLPQAARDEMVFYGVKTIDEAIPLVITTINRVTKKGFTEKKPATVTTCYPPPAGIN